VLSPRASMLSPTVTTLVPAAAAPVAPPVNPWAQYPYGMMPWMPSGGGGGGGDLGPDDYLAPEEDDGAGSSFDEDDGTYFEEAEVPEGVFSEEPQQYAIGEFPEELAQSSSEDEDEGMPEGDEDGPYPGEGSVGG